MFVLKEVQTCKCKTKKTVVIREVKCIVEPRSGKLTSWKFLTQLILSQLGAFVLNQFSCFIPLLMKYMFSMLIMIKVRSVSYAG